MRLLYVERESEFGKCKPTLSAGILIALSRFLSRTPALSTRRFFRLLLGSFSNGPFDVTALGVRMRCHPWDNVADGKLLFAPHRYCPKEFTILRRALANGGVFVDVGANVGAFTLQAAVLDNVQVLAIEPNPAAVDRLKFNLAANDLEGVTVVEAVVGERNGETPFTFNHESIGHSGIGVRSTEGQREVRYLPMRTLSDILSDHKIDSITVLKVDVEGFEDDVLIPFFESAKRSQWPRFLIIEDNRQTRPRILSVLADCDYTPALRTKENIALARGVASMNHDD